VKKETEIRHGFFFLIHKNQQCLKIPVESPIWNSDKALSFFSLVPEKGKKNPCVKQRMKAASC